MNRNGRNSVISASIALPLSLLVSTTITWYLKARNPDNVDITAGLAYLRPILIAGFITFILCMAAAVWFGLRGKRQDSSPELALLGLTLVVVITLLSFASGVAQKGVSDAEDTYRSQQSKELFDSSGVIDDQKQP